MNIEEFRAFCLSFPGTDESFPFGEDALVFKVMGKMFALTNVETFQYINLKCDPEKAVRLRDAHPEVTPGYHMNKKHWNTIDPSGDLTDDQIRQWTKDSYDLVVARLSQAMKKELK